MRNSSTGPDTTADRQRSSVAVVSGDDESLQKGYGPGRQRLFEVFRGKRLAIGERTVLDNAFFVSDQDAVGLQAAARWQGLRARWAIAT